MFGPFDEDIEWGVPLAIFGWLVLGGFKKAVSSDPLGIHLSLPAGAQLPNQGPSQEVEALLTPMASGAEVRQLFETALHEQPAIPFAVPGAGTLADLIGLTANAASMLTAHSALETGSWKHMFHFNFGNTTQVPTSPGQFYRLKAPGSDEKTPHHYTVFLSPRQGADALINFLRSKRYEDALPAAMRGDCDGYVAALKAGGYFGDSLEQREAIAEGYRKAVCALFKKFRAVEGDSAVQGGVKFRPLIKLGCRGIAVKEWQRYLGLKEDGIFGRDTTRATVAFQKANNLTADGIVGPYTWAVVDSEDA